MVNPVIIQIAAERILSGGINPKTGNVYVLNDISNEEFKQAVKDHISLNKQDN